MGLTRCVIHPRKPKSGLLGTPYGGLRHGIPGVRKARQLRNSSFAPSGLAFRPLWSQGLRPGLHSYAASRLICAAKLHLLNAASSFVRDSKRETWGRLVPLSG